MSGPEDIEIIAENIDKAVAKIIDVLEDTSKGNVIYVGGWRGFGASTALKGVARRLKSSKSKFEKVIHVDCSVWNSMRALQKAVAEELDLPQSVMAIFDQCDADDDFNGKDENSRGVISDIRREIFEKLANSRFVVILHNGSRRYIDFYECGVPAIPFLRNKVLWTWHGMFRHSFVLDDGEEEKMRMQSDVYLSTPFPGFSIEYEDAVMRNLMREEVVEVANCTRIAEPNYMNHKIVEQCVLYGWLMKRIVSPTGVDLDTHRPNYWVCDGIIQGQGNTSYWEIGQSLQRNMNLDWFFKKNRGSTSAHYRPKETLYRNVYKSYAKNVDATNDFVKLLTDAVAAEADRWNFTTNEELPNDNTRLPPEVTSFFLFAHEPPRKTTSILPVRMFQHSERSKLRVLHLSHCSFNFASPPFFRCAQLRLLHLDHCINITDEEHPSHNENISCFQKLWVLDLRYTDWYWLLSEKMKSLMADLRELNVEGVKHGSISDLCGGRPSLVILRVTEDPVPTENEDTNSQAQFPSMSSANSLTTSSFMEIDSSSPASRAAVGGREVAQGIGSQQQIAQYLYASDVFQEDPQAVSAIEGVISWIWVCPPIPSPGPQDWYFHMQDEEKMERGSLQQQHNTKRFSTSSVTLAPVLMCDNARMLYVHDSSSITSIPYPPNSDWRWLEWCRVERCPKLCSFFATPQDGLRNRETTFRRLCIFWASQLPEACYICTWSAVAEPDGRSFEGLAFLHLDYCPRLIHVLPLSFHMATLPSLETLEIVCCGDLKQVFPSLWTLGAKRRRKL